MMHVLFADDDADTRLLVVKALTSAGYEVFPVRDGEEALAQYWAHRHEYDVLVLDNRMPRVRGMQILASLRAAGDSVSILIHSDEDCAEEALRLGGSFARKSSNAESVLAYLSALKATP